MDAIFGFDTDTENEVPKQLEKTPEQLKKEYFEEIKKTIINYYANRDNGKVVKRKIIHNKNNIIAFDYLKRAHSYDYYINYTMADIVHKLNKYNILDNYEKVLGEICDYIHDIIDIDGYIDFIPLYFILTENGYTQELQDLATATWKIINTKSSAVSIGQLKKRRQIRSKDKLDAIEKLSSKLHEEYEASETIVVTSVYNLYKIFELDIPDDILNQFVDCIMKLIEFDTIEAEKESKRHKKMSPFS